MKPDDPEKMMQQARAMQQRIEEAQKAMNARRFEASSGGGMVKAAVSGALRVVAIEIEDALFRAGDKEMIQDLVAAAINAALAKVQAGADAEFASIHRQILAGGGL